MSWLTVLEIATILFYLASLDHVSGFSWNSGASISNGWFGSLNNRNDNQQAQEQQQPPSNIHLLILPGFGNEALDYTKEGSLVEALRKRNWRKDQIHVVPLNRFDWLLVFVKGLLDQEFIKGQADPTRPAFRWYLQRVATAIDKIVAKEEEILISEDTPKNGDLPQRRQIILLGHSAGGWLARASVGFCGIDKDDEMEEDTTNTGLPSDSASSPLNIPLDRIMGIVTLGAPNQPPPPGVMDMTQGALTTTCQRFPSATYFNNRNIFYMTVIGNTLQGEYQSRKSFLEPSTPKGFAFESYRTVCGMGETIGDGVVPTSAGHIDDAVQITLDGVFHSMNEPKLWYGADAKIDLWHDTMLQLINNNKKTMLINGKIPEKNESNDNSFAKLLSGDLTLWSFKK